MISPHTQTDEGGDAPLKFTYHPDIDSIGEVPWMAWHPSGNLQPFTAFPFLSQLERSRCVGREYGWQPHHLLLTDMRGNTEAVMPLYVKYDGYGEFVFDHIWQSAYEAHRRQPYYPKLVCGVPHTPVTGKRLFCATNDTAMLVVNEAVSRAEKVGVSGIHWLFIDPSEQDLFQKMGLPLRLGCQYHWNNAGYTDFEDFLSTLKARRRKTIRRERRWVKEQGIVVKVQDGNELGDDIWVTLHALYRETFDRKWGYAVMNYDFFSSLSKRIAKNIVAVTASSDGEIVACALFFRSQRTLYGRYWGCYNFHNCLHFEVCYYAAIEYCIKNRLDIFEPGAQGEHKISRGFLPTATWSAHYMCDHSLMQNIRRFCQQEQQAMYQHMLELFRLSPFSQGNMPQQQQQFFQQLHSTTNTFPHKSET